MTPRQSIEAECGRRGRRAVTDGCARLIAGDYDDEGLIRAIGGPGAGKYFDGRPHEDQYWIRVWGTRGLLWVWDGGNDSAADAVATASASCSDSGTSWGTRG